jgi:hypothetical protein
MIRMAKPSRAQCMRFASRRASANRAPPKEKDRAEAFFLCERRRIAANSKRDAPAPNKRGASRLLPLGTAGADGAR